MGDRQVTTTPSELETVNSLQLSRSIEIRETLLYSSRHRLLTLPDLQNR